MNTLKFGNGEWYGKKDTILAYNDENSNFKPLPFSFDRASSATRVNKDGLIETVGSGEPRIDYKDDSKGALLLEPTRSNYLTNSDNGSNYTVFSATKTLNQVISLDGTLNSFTLEGNGDYNQVLGETVSITLPSGGDYTFSVFAKKGTNDFIQLFFNQFSGSSNGEAYFDLENGTTSSSFGRIENYGNGWYKCSVVGTVLGSDLSGKMGFRISYTPSYFFFPTANDTIGKNAYFYGFQLEQGSYATSYIPTQGGVVTRVADACNNGANEQVINSTEGVFYFEGSALADDGTNRFLSLNDGTTNNYIYFRYVTTSNQYLFRTKVGGAGVNTLSGFLTDTTENHKFAFKFKSGDYAMWVDGVEISNDTSSTIFPSNTLSNIEFSFPTDGGSNFQSKTRDLRVYNTALTDQELQALTTI